MKKRYIKSYIVSLLLAFGLFSLAFNVYNKHGKYDATAKENARGRGRLRFELENLERAAATSDPVVLSPIDTAANPEIFSPTASPSESEMNVTQQVAELDDVTAKEVISDRVKKVWPTCKDGDGTCDGPLGGPPTCAGPYGILWATGAREGSRSVRPWETGGEI